MATGSPTAFARRRCRTALRVNVIRALDDPHLFAPHFRGESWGAWRSFLKAWSGLGAQMTEAEAALFR